MQRDDSRNPPPLGVGSFNSLEDVTLIILHALLSREDVNIPWAMDKALEMARIFKQTFKEETK